MKYLAFPIKDSVYRRILRDAKSRKTSPTRQALRVLKEAFGCSGSLVISTVIEDAFTEREHSAKSRA